ncbi:MAG TPA: type II toxin-antitoxin system HicA family toxin [Ktedonobacterales bacterium]|nr:type II toxin-antitoxin system HicA family toxin [Ktedonobacterales bacterium]
MPRKVRELRADLRRAGYVQKKKRGKGSHTWWVHPSIPGYNVNIAGQDGADAHRYQEELVQEALDKARKVK